MPNWLVTKFVWPIIYKDRNEHYKAHFREALEMQCVSGSIQCYVTVAL